MPRKFTIDDLLLFHYNEMPQEEREAFKVHLLFDEHLKESNQGFLSVKSILDTSKCSPSDTSIKLILDYNRKNSNELEAI